jgi:hypothetical protein
VLRYVQLSAPTCASADGLLLRCAGYVGASAQETCCGTCLVSSKGCPASLEACCVCMAAPCRQPAHQAVATDSASTYLHRLVCKRSTQHKPAQKALVSQFFVCVVDTTYWMRVAHAFLLKCAGWSVPVSCGSAQQRSAFLRPRAETSQLYIQLAARCSLQQQCVWLLSSSGLLPTVVMVMCTRRQRKRRRQQQQERVTAWWRQASRVML